MYTLIKSNIDLILNSPNIFNDIQQYLQIIRLFPQIDVSNDGNFQKIYRKYWRLNAARLQQTFFEVYFDLLEKSKDHSDLKIEKISRKLYKTSTGKDGKKSLQFSFASKLIHTINNTEPVYDSMITTFYFLPQPQSNWNFERKLKNALENYQFIKNEQKRILKEGLLDFEIEKFREYFNLENVYTDQKIIDTLIWKFVTLLRDGAIRERRIIFK